MILALYNVHTFERFYQFKVIIMLVQTEFTLLSIIFLFENCFACNWPWLYVDNVVLTPVRRRSVRSLPELDGKLIFCTHTKNSAIIPIRSLQHSYKSLQTKLSQNQLYKLFQNAMLTVSTGSRRKKLWSAKRNFVKN